jgi:CubicO group peptidase (beta-lactamase class C family)
MGKRILFLSILMMFILQSCIIVNSKEITCNNQPDLDFRSAADYSEEMGGFSMLVMYGDEIIFEEYHNGNSADDAVHLYSATKAFWSVVVAALIQDGIISGYNEKIYNTIEEWENPLYFRKHKITIQHMVELTTGLEQDVDAIQGHEDYTAQDIYAHVINNLSVITSPGSRFQYGPSHYYLLGAYMQDKGLNPLEYLEQRIFNEIGLVYDKWTFDPSGNPHIPNGAYLKAREWVKFGKFLRDRGSWNGKQIIRQDLFEELIIPSENNPGHGKFLWLNTKDGYGYPKVYTQAPEGSPAGFIYYYGHEEIYAAMGAGKCRMYMIPSLDLVVVRQSDNPDDKFVDHVFLNKLLNENNPPDIPTIDGDNSGLPNQDYEFIISSNDPEGELISYYIDWGDGEITDWTQYYKSGKQVLFIHSWNSNGRFEIKVKAKDEQGAESPWASFNFRMSRNFNIMNIFELIQKIFNL